MHVFLLPREYATQLAEMEQEENIHPYPSAALISPKSSSNKKISHARVLDFFAHKNQIDFDPILAVMTGTDLMNTQWSFLRQKTS